MSEQDWRAVVAALRRHTSGPTDEQMMVCQRLGIDLDRATPYSVAAALLRRHLRASLALPLPPDVTEGQLEYLTELVALTCSPVLTEVSDRDLLDSWVAVMHARRAAEHLERWKPMPSDVVVFAKGIEESYGQVSSISSDGRLNFYGGLGLGVRPHNVYAIIRKSAEKPYADAVQRSRQCAAAAVKNPQRVGSKNLEGLAKWRITSTPSYTASLALRDALGSATDERPMQVVLEKHPEILAYLVDGHHGLYVKPQVELGNQYVADFMIAGRTSLGLFWTLVELESPTAELSIKDGQPAKNLRKAIQQISDWREWLSNNLGYARSARSDGGLGLTGIRSDAPGLIIIGRGQISDEVDVMRHRIRNEQRIIVRTYDFLVRESRKMRGLSLGVDDEIRELIDEHEL